MKRFLNEYDYLSTSRSGNHDVESAIKDFQRFAGLEVICELDEPTIRLKKTPRCGNPDDVAFAVTVQVTYSRRKLLSEQIAT